MSKVLHKPISPEYFAGGANLLPIPTTCVVCSGMETVDEGGVTGFGDSAGFEGAAWAGWAAWAGGVRWVFDP